MYFLWVILLLYLLYKIKINKNMANTDNTQTQETPQVLQQRVQLPNTRIGAQNIRFAQSDKELVDLHLKCFKNYLTETIGYSRQDPEDREALRILTALFKAKINDKNIRNYCNHPAGDIYLGLINNNLEEKVANIGFTKNNK